MAYLYILTHCQSLHNKKGIFSGQSNPPLTLKGHKDAKLLAEQLKNKRIDRAYTSPLKRSKHTLKHILKYHPNTKVSVDKRIIERDYGKLTNKNKAKYEKDNPELYPSYHRSYETPPPGGESMKQVEKRVLSFLEEVIEKAKKDNSNILIITHSNSIRPVIRYFENLSSEEMMKLEGLRHKIYKYKL